jgi:hypothetical protein
MSPDKCHPCVPAKQPAPPYVLPLVFAASTGVTAGSYRVEASATGYTAKSVDGVSIATANQTGVNFTLAP